MPFRVEGDHTPAREPTGWQLARQEQRSVHRLVP
jgi:hypothetical protein